MTALPPACDPPTRGGLCSGRQRRTAGGGWSCRSLVLPLGKGGYSCLDMSARSHSALRTRIKDHPACLNTDFYRDLELSLITVLLRSCGFWGTGNCSWFRVLTCSSRCRICRPEIQVLLHYWQAEVTLRRGILLPCTIFRWSRLRRKCLSRRNGECNVGRTLATESRKSELRIRFRPRKPNDRLVDWSWKVSSLIQSLFTEWPKKMYTLFTHQYLWNKFKWNFYFRVRV